MHRKYQRFFQSALTLLLTLALAFSIFLTQPTDRAAAGTGIVARWSGFGWYASSGSSNNAVTALLSTNTTGPFNTSSGAPSGETGVYISTGWANGSLVRFWKVHFNSTGFQNLTVSSQQMSTNLGYAIWNGPRDFKLQYSIDDSTWTDVAGGGLTLANVWSSSGRLTNLSLPPALDNQPNVYLRWIMTSNTSVTPAYPTTDNDAQSMIAGITVNGSEIPLAPTDIELSGTSVNTSAPAGTAVGTLSVVDPNSYDIWTYSLAAGAGDTNNSSFHITGNQLITSTVLPAGSYSVRINVNDGTYNFAKVFAIQVLAYPTITGGNTEYDDYITNVTFAGINNTSDMTDDHPGYQDFTAFSGSVMQGAEYTLSTSVNVGCPDPPVAIDCGGIVFPQYIKAWFDWNQNGSFDDVGEGVDININTTSNGPHTVQVIVPNTAAIGATRMRIANSADNDFDQDPPEPPNAGSTMFFGQAEDYTIHVSGLSITTGAVSGSPFYVIPSRGASLTVPYSIVGTYAAGNVFTAYLSDAAGDFTTETAIGSLTATGAGTINATIPAMQASGSGYRIRVKSSSPVVTGSDNGSSLQIIYDSSIPVLNTPGDQTVEATGPAGAAYTFTATANDNDPLHPSVTCEPASGSTFPLGSTEVYCRATDTAGNTGARFFDVTVVDTTPPDITVPDNPTLEAAGPSGTVHTYTAAATDLVAPANPQVSCAPVSGSLFPIGDTTVTCSAIDSTGNDASETFTVTVQDTTTPVVTVPSNATLEAAGPSGAVHTFSAGASDLIGPASPSVTCVPASGSIFPVGSSTVTCSATDTAGNTGSSTFTVAVQDTTPPVVTVPDNATIEAAGPSGAVHNFTATAADLVAPIHPVVSCTPASGSTFPVGETTVHCDAEDTAGNTGSSTFTVNVTDTTAPVVTVPSNATIEATGPSGAVHTFSATAVDLVDLDIPSVTCSPASGSTFALGETTVTCSANDDGGNTGSSTFTVAVVDTTPPDITVPDNPIVEATGPSGAAYAFSAGAADLVAPLSPAVTCDPASGSTFAFGDTTTVTCSATDTAGNSASKTFTVTVQDTTGPVLTLPEDAFVEAAGPDGAVYSFSATAADLVDPADAAVTCSHLSGSTFPLGVTEVSCSAEDTAGNPSSAAFSVTVQDTTPPVVTVPDNVSLEWAEPSGPTLTYAATATDLVGPSAPAVTCDPPSGSSFPLGSTTVTCSAIDDAGNTGSSTFTVSVWNWIRTYFPFLGR